MNLDPKQTNDVITRYLSMWHEPDADRRHAIVQGLWADDAENISRRFIVRGIADIIQRVDRAHLEWVQAKRCIFRATDQLDAHNNLIIFPWEMVPRDGGQAEARGQDVFVLNEAGRIRSLYHFAAAAQPASV